MTFDFPDDGRRGRWGRCGGDGGRCGGRRRYGCTRGDQADILSVDMTVELRPFRIGSVRVAGPIVLAPLAGYTDVAYRLICRRRGAPFCATEMALDRCMLVSGKLRNRLVRNIEEDHPLAGQLIGGDPATMAKAAQVMVNAGVEVVDLNFACPVRKALSRGRGGHMMRDPDRAVAITRAVLAAVECPVTMKLRQAFYRKDDTYDSFYRIAEAGFDAGVAAICVHARSVEIRYGGSADWGFLADVKRHFAEKTILGSGDVLEPAAALAMLEQTGVDAVSVARGALGNPWFFRQVLDLADGRAMHRPTLAEQRDLLRRHFVHACEIYGPVRGPKIMRKFGIKYARIHPTPRRVRIAFAAVRRPSDWMAVLGECYDEAGMSLDSVAGES